MKALNYIKQPFPKQESKWKLIISISLFVAVFLIIFQPFGSNLMESNFKLLILSGYGLVTFVVLFINLILIENLFPKVFSERSWTIGKEFFWLSWIIFSIGLGNAFYTNYLIHYFKFNFWFFIMFQFITLVVGIIPVILMIISKQKYLLHKNLNSASELNKSLVNENHEINQNKVIRFLADNEKDFIEFDLNDFLYIESSGNYIELYLIEKDELVRKTFRGTLKHSLDFFNEVSGIIQCHRAYIVNIAKITSSTGNSQGLRLSIKNCNTEIPVSRNYVNSIKKMILLKNTFL